MAGQTDEADLMRCTQLGLCRRTALGVDGRAVGGCAFFDSCGLPAFEVLQCLGNLSICKTNQESNQKMVAENYAELFVRQRADVTDGLFSGSPPAAVVCGPPRG